jgi:hypothetical protein
MAGQDAGQGREGLFASILMVASDEDDMPAFTGPVSSFVDDPVRMLFVAGL